MNQFNFTANDIIKTYNDYISNARNEADKECEDALEALRNAKPEEFNAKASQYRGALRRMNRAYEIKDGLVSRNIAKAYAKFVDIANELGYQMKATIDDDKIIIPCAEGQSDFMLIMLAKYFDIHSGMFTFKSSFTVHDAYLEEEGQQYWAFKFGHSDDRYDTLVIETCLRRKPDIFF